MNKTARATNDEYASFALVESLRQNETKTDFFDRTLQIVPAPITGKEAADYDKLIGDFDLGDLMNTILGGLQEENYKIDPFLTNLARGIVAVEGTVKTLSPKINILNFFMDKVSSGLDFKLNLEHPEEMNPEIAMKLIKLANGLTNSAVKSAETLDMLEKGQIKVRTDFGFEEKALETVNRLVGYVIRTLLIIAILIGSCLLCTTSALTGDGVAAVTIVFRAIGFVGIIVSLFFAQRLYRELKKGK